MTTKNVNVQPTAIKMQTHSTKCSMMTCTTPLAMVNQSTSFNYNNDNQCQINESAFKLVNNSTKSATTTTTTNTSFNELNQITESRQRSSDQEYIFHRIEDVHNYAKLSHYGDSNDYSDSSLQEDDEDDDEDIPDVDMIDYNEDTYVHYIDRRQRSMSDSIHKSYVSSDDKTNNNNNNNNNNKIPLKISRTISEDSEYIDVETVPKDRDTEAVDSKMMAPDHHARRPMNAFLIFCKRHRAIVKEKYKTLENRAITRILGDWWASLDERDKICFTELAKMNKDVFFSANPNFKWYKLPAPPLRTLNTRPSNLERSTTITSFGDESPPVSGTPTMATLTARDSGNFHKSDNYFKFAELNQMGELNSLINDEQQQQQQQQQHGATKFMDATKANNYNENSFSSNSSEEDGSPKKPSRSCKGKIYQELVNSGQIASSTKKTKHQSFNNVQQRNETSTATTTTSLNNNYLTHFNTSGKNQGNIFNRRSFSESETIHYNLTNFDLEERIRELPALSLDDYLARKRDTKKKKKFTPKKRPTNMSSLNKSQSLHTKIDIKTPVPNNLNNLEVENVAKTKVGCASEQIVGSRKRKARKESITRRDVSSIENEVTALIPSPDISSSLGTCYYINRMPDNSTVHNHHPLDNNPIHSSNKISSLSISSLNMNDIVDINSNVNELESSISASTSDLFILAEVAAKRTELMNS